MATDHGPVPALGERVMLRRRLPPGASHPMTDALGILTGRDPVTVRTRDGLEVRVAEADVVALRAIPPAPVRTRDIRALEHAAALAWPGTEHTWLDGWLLRAGHGFTGRANSCVPLGDAPEDGVARVRDWYAARGLPPRFVMAERLSAALRTTDLPDFEVGERVHVLTADVNRLGGTADTSGVEVRADLDDAWLHRYRYRGDLAPA
ncbi:MAG: GNAT family N-acetyltransferase, partial [Mycobacteriaceae bacterium]